MPVFLNFHHHFDNVDLLHFRTPFRLKLEAEFIIASKYEQKSYDFQQCFSLLGSQPDALASMVAMVEKYIVVDNLQGRQNNIDKILDELNRPIRDTFWDIYPSKIGSTAPILEVSAHLQSHESA